MTPRRAAMAALPLALLGLGAAPYVPWEDLTEADALYAVATRFATVDGHRVHYATPTAELVAALEQQAGAAALRHLAEARRESGDLAGARAALERWAEAEGPEAWAEAARWGAAQGEHAFAFRAAGRALPGLPPEAMKALADEQVAWADAHPDAADPLALRAERARLFPADARAVEDWIRALESAGRLDEAERAVAAAEGLPPARRLLLRSDLLADHGQARRAFEVLDTALDGPEPLTRDVREAYAERVEKGSPGAPESWRATLDRRFEPAALLRLATLFQGQGRGDAAADLLAQVERRHEKTLDRAGWLLLARLHGEIDAVPEAFRARLAAAQNGTPEDQAGDLAALARLALRAGGRPLAWGTYNDEPYRWVARLDRTPGFWTGGVSFLLTGQDWKEALARIESDSLPDRTFAAGRALVAELAARVPAHPELPSLRAAVMARHVERGEGKEALALLPLVESGPPEAADTGRRAALLALRQTQGPLEEELRLFRARLRVLAPNGSKPEMIQRYRWREPYDGGWSTVGAATGRAWTRRVQAPERERYADVLDEAVGRLDRRDPSHRAALDLVLGEMDRLPEAEGLWEHLADRLDVWNLDDELGPRYERAMERFEAPGWWARAARWYARRERAQDLRRLADELVARFRSAGILERSGPDSQVRMAVPEQPPAGGRVRLVFWADWVRWKALERFPHSPAVFREARVRLLRRSDWERDAARLDKGQVQRLVVDDALLDERSWALLFAGADRREELFARAMQKGDLEARLVRWEEGERTPVEEMLLFEGWSRLSRFERAAAPAARLAAAYPGDGALAGRVLSLHRSLAGLDPAHAEPAAALVARAAPALTDPAPLWTELGELEEERGRPEAAKAAWARILDREPRSPRRISDLATVLWDYGHMREALDAVEQGRQRLGRPHLLAFEAGVLREELRDADGAIREYLGQGTPESDCFCSSFESDQRALRRLAQLLSRERVRRLVEGRIEALRPGVRDDERALVALLPLSTIGMPDDTLDHTADDWIDTLDQPVDPVGRAERERAREAWRPDARAGIEGVGGALLAKTLALLPRATEAALLDAVEPWSRGLLERDRDKEVDFRSALLARRAELAPDEESRIAQEVARARYLFENGRGAEADAVWAALAGRIDALPEGGPRLHAEADRAAYLERARGVEEAAAEWAGIGGRYPWSLGLLEDRLAFLNRHGRGAEARALIEGVAPSAAPGHREPLLERLTREALLGQDLDQARRAVERLLGEPGLTEAQRLGAVHLLGRLSIRLDPAFDPLPLAAAQAPSLDEERHAELYMQLARAADAERAWTTGVTLWIEALNRRLERAWLRDACRTAVAAGRVESFRGFFEKQQQRSPRDVRWAVAVREIRLHSGDLEGAIEAARAAIAVRPERESLWREAADLLVRADRPRDAALLLEGWAKPRPADEGSARNRSLLWARAGDGDKALAVERATLAAYAKEAPSEDSDRARELQWRRGRAARRLLEAGFPKQAWALVTPGGKLAALDQSGLDHAGDAELALASGNYLRLLRHRADDAEYRAAAARLLAERGRPELREEVQAFVLGQVFPPTASGRTSGSPVLADWWPFVEQAGIEGPVRTALARRALAASPGPWQAGPPAAFVESVAGAIVRQGRRPAPGRVLGAIFGSSQPGAAAGGPAEPAYVLETPPLAPLWMRDLVRRDDAPGLVSFLDGRWRDLLAQVRSAVRLDRKRDRVDWASWLDDKDAIALWARGAAADPARWAEVSAVFGERRLWDRLWLLAARNWDVGPLVIALPEDARVVWLRQWQQPSPTDPDPVKRARGEAIESASLAVGRLVAGASGSAADPAIAKLRGPRTVGDVVGADPRWTWPEFTPRKDVGGELLETGDDRVVGQRSDALRLPGALWGERPGAAWYALETLARLRENDGGAALVPLELPDRGRETERRHLAVRLAEATGREGLAVELAEPLEDPAGLARRLALLARTPRKEQAAALFRDAVVRQQPRLDEPAYRALRRIAEDAGLPAPAEVMDPGVTVSGALLAFLHDREGMAVGGRFTARDVVDFRSALARRWGERPGALGADEVRFWLDELWTSDAAPLPTRGLRRLGGVWPRAGAWLSRLRPADRAEGLAALAALPDAARLDALLARDPEPASDAVRLLRVRVHLLRGEAEAAVALLDARLAELGAGDAIAYEPAALAELAADEEGFAELLPEPEPAAHDPFSATLADWLAPFREAGRAELAVPRVREALFRRRASGYVPAGAWGLSFALASSPEDRAALAAELEQAWRRGDWSPEGLGPLVEALARSAPDEAPRWIARGAPSYGYDDVARRAFALARLKDERGAAGLLVAARSRSAWTQAEEVKAFDLWRGFLARAGASPRPGAASAPEPAAGPAPPPTWTAARAFWTKKAGEVGADLAAHLRAHPHDLLAARAALRTAAPGEAEAMHLAGQLLAEPAMEAIGDPYGDRALLALRTARGLLPSSARAAARAAGAFDPASLAGDLRRRRMASADVQAAMADLARIAAATGGGPRVEAAVSVLEDLGREQARALRTELRELEKPAGPPAPYRLEGGRPVPYRPRDLDWRTVAAALAAGGFQP